MNRATVSGLALLVLLASVPVAASARGLGIELWTDRGQDAVYQPGDGIQVKVRTSADAYLLVYEIDSEGYVHLLFPSRDGRGYIEGRQTHRIPEVGARDELVVEGPTGEGYIVAISSLDAFESLPWYLRPYDPRAAEVGYVGGSSDQEGVTSDGRIVGDPFVAMERIRRQVLPYPDDRDEFATAYTSYYVHQRVRYPRYICYDCHRPTHWSWWDGYDPYYTSCSVFQFRVNWGWCWGPTYWFGYTPYYVYVVRDNCPPRYRPNSGWCYSAWDGWPRWNALWTGRLTRYKSPPPPGYVPPSKYGFESRKPGVQPMPARPTPPGFLANAEIRGRRGVTPMPARKIVDDQPVVARTDWRPRGELKKPVVGRLPDRGPVDEDRVPRGRSDDPDRGYQRGQRPGPPREAHDEDRQIERRSWDRPEPPRRAPEGDDRPVERGRYERPAPREAPPRSESPRVERPAPRRDDGGRSERPAPREERGRDREAPRVERPHQERPAPPRHERSEPAKEEKGKQR